MSTVVFVDLQAPKSYDASTLAREATGGTIGTLIRVAEGLAKNHNVFVIQESPPKDPHGAASYVSLDALRTVSKPDACVFVRGNMRRGEASVPAIRARYPQCKLFYWSHTTMPQPWLTLGGRLYGLFTTRTFKRLAKLFEAHGVRVLGTSQFHTRSIRRTLGAGVSVGWIYNPVDEVEEGDTFVPYDPDKLLFLSSPDRGLKHAIRILAEARRIRPTFRLYAASPGYVSGSRSRADGLVYLGPLPRQLLFKHIRESLCVLYPNLTCVEAFGLVYAESNNLGTPVLTHPLGAASEVLSHPDQLVDCRNDELVVQRLVSWSQGQRPRVRGRTAYRLRSVIPLWEDLFTSDEPVAFHRDP